MLRNRNGRGSNTPNGNGRGTGPQNGTGPRGGTVACPKTPKK